MTHRTRRIVAVVVATIVAGCLTSLARGGASGPLAPDQATALAPDATLCATRSSFCGAILRIESSTGTIGSVAAGAHYGSAWGIPATPNDSAGTGWCVDDTHTGFPAGPISERPLPTQWAAHEQRVAATIISLYGGDSVLPYQPLAIDATGELVGEAVDGTSPTRLRHVAVWLALRSVLADPTGTPRIDLASATSYSDRAGRHPSPIGNAAIPLAHEMVSVARSATARGGSPVVTTEISADELGVEPDTVIYVPVRVTDPTGRPIAHVPVWPERLTNVAVSAHASDDRASLQANGNAVLAGWPSFDTTTTRSDAAVTDMNGVAYFSLRVLTSGLWSASFTAETTPTRLLLFGDGIRAQNNVSLRGDRPTLATASLEGDATQRHVRVVKTSTDNARSVAGATFALLDADGTEIARATTGDDGSVDFVVGSRHVPPLRIREVAAPPGLRAVVGDIDVTAGDAPVSTDPNRPTIVTVENEPVLHEVSIAKRVVGGPSEPADLSDFAFTVSPHGAPDDAELRASTTAVTGIDGRTPTMQLPSGDYDIVEVARPAWWPDDDPLPTAWALSIPVDNDGAIVVTIDNVFPAPAVTTTAPATTIESPPATAAPPSTTGAPPPTTVPPSPTTTTAAAPPSTVPPSTVPPTTAPPTTVPPTAVPPTAVPPTAVPPAPEPPTEPPLPRTGAPWRIWYRIGSLVVLAGAALFFASTIGLGLGLGSDRDRARTRARRAEMSTTRTNGGLS